MNKRRPAAGWVLGERLVNLGMLLRDGLGWVFESGKQQVLPRHVWFGPGSWEWVFSFILFYQC